jgi:starch-binding outer membrane protein, SusD/RagB family
MTTTGMTTGARYMKNRAMLGALLLTGLVAGGCDLDLNDPNFPTEEVVFGDGNNLLAIGVGIQAEMAGLMGPFIFSSSITTFEMGAGAQTFPNFQNADVGSELETGQYLSEAPWGGGYRVIKLANDLLRAVPDANLRAGTASGLLALARTFKAMTFAQLATLFPAAPIEAGIDNPNVAFADREVLLAEAISLLEAARAGLAATPLSDEFRTQVQAPGFDLGVTIEAMLARYNLMAGNYAAAAAAAEGVPAAGRSEFRFSATDRNSVFVIMYSSGNPYQVRARQLFRTEAEPGDQRVPYWVTPAAIAGANFVLDDLAKYRAADEPIPVFLPDEMRLIRAEAAARLNDLATARDLINEVRTQCNVTGEPAACLEALDAGDLPTQAAVLAEILKQRRYELFLQGLRFDDLRRFDAPRKYDFLPIPQSECDRNTSAPC